MKKLIAVTLALLLALSAAFCVSEGFSFASYSDSELLALIRAAQQEAADRKLSLTAELMGGTYIAGEDIPTGKYVMKTRFESGLWTSVTIYGNRGNGDQKLWDIITEDEGEYEKLITLENGDELECDAAFTLTVYTGVMFR